MVDLEVLRQNFMTRGAPPALPRRDPFRNERRDPLPPGACAGVALRYGACRCSVRSTHRPRRPGSAAKSKRQTPSAPAAARPPCRNGSIRPGSRVGSKAPTSAFFSCAQDVRQSTKPAASTCHAERCRLGPGSSHEVFTGRKHFQHAAAIAGVSDTSSSGGRRSPRHGPDTARRQCRRLMRRPPRLGDAHAPTLRRPCRPPRTKMLWCRGGRRGLSGLRRTGERRERVSSRTPDTQHGVMTRAVAIAPHP